MNEPDRASTGIQGLDDILGGGFLCNRLFLIEGMPGSGKTTLAFHFLLEGVKAGERVLYVTLSETEEEIRAVADSHGWSLEGIAIRELAPATDPLLFADQYTVFHPSEVELSETTKKILADVDRLKPTRVVFDSLSELRLLAGNALRYRRQILALKQYFAGRRCTVLMLDDLTAAPHHDLQVQSIAHGSVLLEHSLPAFGALRRRLSVSKFRGSSFRGGYHDYVIRRGGLEVFPRLVAAEHRKASTRERLASGLEGLDRLMGGGLERGTSTLITGAAGTGKSTIGSLFCATSAEQGRRSALFVFDESMNTLFSRLDGLDIDLRRHAEAGLVTVVQVDPAEMSPGELVQRIRHEVETREACIIMIDSLNGYLNSMPDANDLIIQLHELLTYLGQHGVATILVSAHIGLVSSQMTSPVDASYLADSVVLLRYYEAEGEVRQAMSVIKMRGGEHERTLRDFSMNGGHLRVGEPLREYRGVLTGVPEKRVKT
jgi:circadian clock protein KaiC